MTRRRWLFALGSVVVVGAAVAAGVIAGNSAARPFGPPRLRAQQLLHQLVLPLGAQRLRAEPRGDGGLLKRPSSAPGLNCFRGHSIDLHRIWRVHRSYFSVPSFVQNHLPGDAHGELRGSASGPGIPYNNEDDSYSLPTSGNVSVFWLDLTFVRLPHGWTGIRADALVGGCPLAHH